MFRRWNEAKPNVVTAEAVKAQASKIVQDLHKEADILRTEIDAKKKELAGLQPVIDARFREREEAVVAKEGQCKERVSVLDARQGALEAGEKRLATDRALLEKDRTGLDAHLRRKEEATEQVIKGLADDRALLNADRQLLTKDQAQYKASLVDLEARELALVADRVALDQDKESWYAREKDLSSREEALRQAEAILKAARILNDDATKATEKLILEQRTQLKETQEELEKLANERTKNKLMLADIELREKELATLNQTLTEERNTLNVQRAVQAKKEREFSERETNLKKVEAEHAVRT